MQWPIWLTQAVVVNGCGHMHQSDQ